MFTQRGEVCNRADIYSIHLAGGQGCFIAWLRKKGYLTVNRSEEK